MAKLNKREWRQKNHLPTTRERRAESVARRRALAEEVEEVTAEELLELGKELDSNGEFVSSEEEEVTADEAEVILTDLDEQLGEPELEVAEAIRTEDELLDQK